MNDEEVKFQEEALETIKRRHHHDGSEVILNVIDDTRSIERKILEDENLWKLKTQQQSNIFQNSISHDTKTRQPQQSEETAIIKRKNDEVMASCNCGKSFSAEKEGQTVRITAFDVAGNISGIYSVSGSSPTSYGGVPGQQKEGYSVGGRKQDTYAV